MPKIVWLISLSISALLIFPPPEAWAGQAVAAPTRPVYTKNLNAPDIPSDTRNLEAIVDNEPAAATDTAAATNPAPAPQTILVMPSAVAAPAPTVPAPVAAPVQPEPAHEVVHGSTPAVPPMASASSDTGDEADSWHQWTSRPASVFTAFIALFAFLLALAGGWYVYAAGATAKRQLRGYIFITGTEINGVSPMTQPVAQLAIRNTGQTPAHDVIVYGNMVFDEFPLKQDLPVLVFSDPQLTKENLGPGGERYKWEYALTPLTEAQVNQMNAGTHALYVYGEIRYRDVFGKKRYTKYLYYTGGSMGVRGTILGGYPEGNEAV